jgi:hypothetical protein
MKNMKPEETYAFQLQDLAVAPGQIECMMGYSGNHPAPEPVAGMIEEVMKEAPVLSDIRGGYVITPGIRVDRERKKLCCGSLEFNTQQIVTHQLRHAEAAAWFVCTVGEKISGLTSRLMKEGDLLRGYVVDVLANVVVDLAMDRIQEDLAKKAGTRGWKITNRYSPGYCGWDIVEQKKLFSLLPERFLGVTLTDSSLMQPLKSISGVIGMGSRVKFSDYGCTLCDDKDCIYRNKTQ